MSYREQLRQRVGQAPLLLVKATVAVLDKRHRILLVKREQDEKWNIPEGFMELKETAEETGQRIVFQLAGLKLGELGLLGVYSGEQYYTVSEQGEATYPVILNFVSKDIKEIPNEPQDTEAIEARFFPLDQLPAETAQLANEVIQQYGPAFF